MSWLSETLHGHFNNPLAIGLGVGAAALTGGLLLPEIGAGLGIGGAAAAGAGEAAAAGGLGLAEAGGLGAEALAFAPEAAGFGETAGLDAISGTFGESLGLGGTPLTEGVYSGPASFLEAGAGTPQSFYEAVGAPGGTSLAAAGESPASTALDYIAQGPPLSGAGSDVVSPIASSTSVGGAGGPSTLEMAAGAPFEGTPQAAGANTSGSFFDKLVSGATSSITKNPIGTAVAGGGLLYNMLTGSKTSAEMKALGGQAGQLGAQGQQLMSYLQSGTLPPGLQQGITNATNAMRARIIANHAKNGMSTDPSQNSALAQELNNVDLQAQALIAQQGEQLMQLGLNETQLSTQLYTTLEKLNRDQSASMGRAIATFASALGGGGINLKLAA